MGFDVIWVFRNTIDRTGFNALRFVVEADTFGTAIGVDNINFSAHRNGLIGAFGQAHIAVNAVFGDDERHVD